MRKSRLHRTYDGHCADCGYSECPSILIKHHNDGDRSNSGDSNLDKLCPNCHAKRHSPNGIVSFTLDPVQPKIDIDALEWLASHQAVQPNTPELVSVQPKVRVLVNGRYEWVDKPDLDAEGNVLYE